MKRGKFITFEGGEGVGKTTQIKRLAAWLRQRGREVLLTREPGGTLFADRIREILLDPKNRSIEPLLELLLYEVARQDHLARRIQPALARGDWVLCDRFTDATLAYQGFGRGLPLPWIRHLNQIVTGGVRPDLTFFLDLPVKTGLQRAKKREGLWNRLDREAVHFHQKVRQGYLTLAKQERRFCRVDTTRPKDLVFEEIKRRTQRIL